MIMRHIDRSRSTGGGMAASVGIHVGLFLLLGMLIGTHAARIADSDELTEIAYIEARYGEDVAAKVIIKEPPRKKTEARGRGVNTKSAFKPETLVGALAEAPKPEAKPAAAPVPQPTSKPVPAPTPKAKAKPIIQQPKRTQVAAKVDVKAPTLAPKATPQKAPKAATLAGKAPRPKSRIVVDATRLAGSAKNIKTAKTAAPAMASSQQRAAFTPGESGLKSRKSKVAAGDDIVASSSGNYSGKSAVVEAGDTMPSGGGLQQKSKPGFTAAAPALASTRGTGGIAGGKGVLDVDGPAASAGKKSGRRTILDYGSGGGGRGGGLSSRGRIAEPEAKAAIVAKQEKQSKATAAVADVKLAGKGTNMTITGEIKGRQILKSAPAVYSSQAKQKGWEGVVAVHFTVLPDGRVKDNIYLEQSSVHRDLNKAAMAAIKKFKFAALPADQSTVEQWGIITIVFRLN